MKKNFAKTIHPFPARMAPSIIVRELARTKKPLRVLDPMVGSGTTLTTARMQGHIGIGFDTDPLARLISSVWCSDIPEAEIPAMAKDILKKARTKNINSNLAYPRKADQETKDFIKFWFDAVNRRQLHALSEVISKIIDKPSRNFFWCAFSRLIITKEAGASRAMDVSHSRPHRVFKKGPIKPFDEFLNSVNVILKSVPFKKDANLPRSIIRKADARRLPLRNGVIDLILTSPPYLNAIDYLRGHKLSLVWMGHNICELRKIRSGNIGSELSMNGGNDEKLAQVMNRMGRMDKLSERTKSILRRYLHDMNLVMGEMGRVLKKRGRAVLVVGDSNIKGEFIRNSKAVELLGNKNGLSTVSVRFRKLPENRRYLPAPTHRGVGVELQKRMRKEALITFQK